MTEEEWLATKDCPWNMLTFIIEEAEHRASQRKLRLYYCAMCRRIWHLLTKPQSRRAVEVGEYYADGLVSDSDLIEARLEACKLFKLGDTDSWTWVASSAAYEGLYEYDGLHSNMCQLAQASVTEFMHHCLLLHEVFGNPFRTITVNPSWLTSTVIALTSGIYDEKAFDRMAILADALQDAGCDNEEILSHCRQPGEHVRGCWVVDLLLGKS